MADCERCGGKGAVITRGPFAGSKQGVDYCEHCSENLCESCLSGTKCKESKDGKHHLPPEES